MQNLLPPTATQLTDVFTFIELVSKASDKDVKAVVAKMKDQADTALAAQTAAAQSSADAGVKLKQAQNLVESTAALKGELEKKEIALNQANVALDERTKKLATDQRDFKRERSAADAEAKDRDAKLLERENLISAKEDEAAQAMAAAQALVSEYQSKVSALQTIVSAPASN